MNPMSFSWFVLALLAQAPPPAPGAGGDNSTMLAVWGVLLMGAAVMLFFVEIVVPSGGIIALGGAAAMVAGVVLLFRVDTTFGLMGAIAALIAIPVAIGFAMKFWPDLPMGRLLILGNEARTNGDEAAEDATGAGLAAVGEVGDALTDLRPIGMCRFGDRRQECLATGGLIEAGQKVRVVSVDGLQIKVQREG